MIHVFLNLCRSRAESSCGNPVVVGDMVENTEGNVEHDKQIDEQSTEDGDARIRYYKPEAIALSRKEELLVIDSALRECSGRSSSDKNMAAYTCVYDLCCLRGKTGAESKHAVYQKYCFEMSRLVHDVSDSMRGLQETPDFLHDDAANKLAEEWRTVQRSIGFLQFAFKYLDRYYIPSLFLTNLEGTQLATLHDVKQEIVREAKLHEGAELAWRAVASAVRADCVSLSGNVLRDLCCAWFSLSSVLGVKATTVDVLREHLVLSLARQRGSPHGRTFDVLPCPNKDVAQRMRLPQVLVEMIVDCLSGEDFCEMYRIQMQT